MELDQVDSSAPDLEFRILSAERGPARRFAFRVARLACSVAGVHDQNALELAGGGLERYPEIDELVRLWDLERRLDSACEAQLGTHPSTCNLDELQLHPECVEARAVAAVIAAFKADALVAAREAVREALRAGCRRAELESLADQLL